MDVQGVVYLQRLCFVECIVKATEEIKERFGIYYGNISGRFKEGSR